MFEKLLKLNCHSKNRLLKKFAGNLLEKIYTCEINCGEMASSVLFAHNGRGCTIVAAKIDENVVIFQNVSIGTNMKYNKIEKKWENVGCPVIGKNVIVADGAKILGPIIIGDDTFVAAGAIITRDIPPKSIAYSVNKFKPKDQDYDLVYNSERINPKEIIEANKKLITKYKKIKL